MSEDRAGADASSSHEVEGGAPHIEREHRFLVHFTFVAAIVTLAISVLVIIAWQTHELLYASLSADYVPMTMFCAISILMLSATLFLRVHFPLARVSNLACIAIASLVITMSVWVLLDPLLGTDIDLEDFLSPSHERLSGYLIADNSPVSSLVLTLAGLITLLSMCPCRTRPFIRMLSSYLSLAVFAIGLVTVLGYLYGSPLLYGGEVRPLSILSGIAFALIGASLISVRGPSEWPTRIFIGKSVEARLLKVFVPLVVFVVLVSGSLSGRVLSESSNPALTISLLALLTAIVVGYVVAELSSRIGRQIDTTEAGRARAENELRQANQKLNVLNSITRHDALNQLAVILGRLGLAKSQSKDPSVMRQLEESLRAAEAIQRMLEFTGEYQKLGVSGPVWIDVDHAFHAGSINAASKGIAVLNEVSGIEVFADIMFEKVLSNFVDNSIRHGQKVERIHLHHRLEGESLQLVYEDDGMGISPTDKQNLFKRGFGKHTGFGLYLSKEILEFAGFSVKETGVPGTGARFEISVPKGLFRMRK